MAREHRGSPRAAGRLVNGVEFHSGPFERCEDLLGTGDLDEEATLSVQFVRAEQRSTILRCRRTWSANSLVVESRCLIDTGTYPDRSSRDDISVQHLATWRSLRTIQDRSGVLPKISAVRPFHLYSSPCSGGFDLLKN